MHDVYLGLEILFDDPHPALWDVHVEREMLRFLRKRGRDVPEQRLTFLIEAILEGPPRQWFREDLRDDKWHTLRDELIFTRLHELVESGASLPDSAQETYNRIHRDVSPQPHGGHPDTPGPIEDFANMSIEHFIRWSETQNGRPWECGGGWYGFVQEKPEVAMRLLKDASQHGTWPIPPWYEILRQKENLTNVLAREIINILINMPLETLNELALQTARWLQQEWSRLAKASKQELWRRIWDASDMGDAPQGDLDFDMTLNHAGGILGNIIYTELSECIPEVSAGQSPGFPRRLRPDFEKIAKEDSPYAKLARVRIVPMLFVLYRIDPDWTERTFFDRMDLDDEATFDPYLWEGYLSHARCSTDLLAAFKPLLFKILRHLNRIPKRVRHQGAALFIHLAIPPDRGISTNEAKGVLWNIGIDGLTAAAVALRGLLQGADDKASALWRDTVGPWFEEVWPKRSRDKSKGLSEKLAWMAIAAEDAFPYVVNAIKETMTQEEYAAALYRLKMKEEETDLVSRYPEAALTLVDKLVGDDSSYTALLCELLNTISTADPELKETDSFRRLKELSL